MLHIHQDTAITLPLVGLKEKHPTAKISMSKL